MDNREILLQMAIHAKELKVLCSQLQNNPENDLRYTIKKLNSQIQEAIWW